MEKEQINKMADILSNYDFVDLDPSVIQDNKIIFNTGKKTYRVRMPNAKDRRTAEQKKHEYKIDLITNSENVMSRQALIKKLKEREIIDVPAKEREIKKLKDKMIRIYVETAPLSDESESAINEMQEKFNEVKKELAHAIAEVEGYLEPCIESRINSFWYEYVTVLCTEVQIEEDKWEKVWETVDDYDKDETALPHKALTKTYQLISELSK